MGDERQMSDIDRALDRLSAAVSQLTEASASRQDDGAVERQIAEQVAALSAERDRLLAEIETLTAQHEEDARLRAEAAEAVRDALSDLNGLVRAQGVGAQGRAS
jgi:hypothetical protein